MPPSWYLHTIIGLRPKMMDDGLQVDVVFLDFAKAFDRVSHDILLQKLCNFGISGTLLNWCKDYLTNREQRVVIAGLSSSWTVIPSGIPQGSLPGPMFFAISVHSMIYPMLLWLVTQLPCMLMTVKHLE